MNQDFVTNIFQVAFACIRGEAGLVEDDEVREDDVLQHGRIAPPIDDGRAVGSGLHETLQFFRNEPDR